MSIRNSFGLLRHPLLLFLGATLVLAAGLGWLGWRLLQQDRALESQRIRERLEHAAALIASDLRQRIAEIHDQLRSVSSFPESKIVEAASGKAKSLGNDTVLFVFLSEGIRAFPADRLAYYPDVSDTPESANPEFAAGEAYEFRSKEYGKAIQFFRRLSGSPDDHLRAGSLLRLARNLRKSGRFDDSLGVYEELSELGCKLVGGLPAELIARHARCRVFERLQRSSELAEEATRLWADLQVGRWRLSRGAYLFHAQEAGRWLSNSVSDKEKEKERLAFSAAVEWLWDEWHRQNGDAFEGRRSLWSGDRPTLLCWHAAGSHLVARALGPGGVERELRTLIQSTLQQQRVKVALTDANGHEVLSQDLLPEGREVVQVMADGQLPWALQVASADPTVELAELAGRRRLLLASLGLVALVVISGGYLGARAVNRELEVARLQSDFVAAVSHEFRTPLTSLRQYSELLASGRVADDERRQKYYRVLLRETGRLHRLVEGLLDFGRMEARAKEFHMELLSAREWFEDVIGEFKSEVEETGYRVEVAAKGTDTKLLADRVALSHMLWNLLDNAVKYSPNFKTVWVEVDQKAPHLLIRVRDRGLGIEPGEQHHIFEKFVRGSAAENRSALGTGLGLTMVRHIVEAHGGSIDVASEPGQGSTFTIRLPIQG